MSQIPDYELCSSEPERGLYLSADYIDSTLDSSIFWNINRTVSILPKPGPHSN